MDDEAPPTLDECLEALADLLKTRAENELCMARHQWVISEIDKHLAALREEYGMNGLFEAVEVVDGVWGDEDGRQ